jgi:DNA-binding GntR family transcriptional regulator
MTGTTLGDRASIFGGRSGERRRHYAAERRDLTELRLLVELPALRKLAERGFSDRELAVIRELADATMRSARRGDVLGYLQADKVFHLYLLELTAGSALSGIARLVLAPSPGRRPRAEESGQLMTVGAREHRELVSMLNDEMLSAADDLLRQHISGPWADRAVPARGLAGPQSIRCEGDVTWPIA